MSLRLGFDLDGVLADLGAKLSDGEPEPPAPSVGVQPPFDTLHLRGASRQVWRRLTAIENFWETLDEIEPGSVQQLADLARARRWEVIFLTSRPDSEGDSVQLQSQRWLAEKGFPLPSVFVTKDPRGRIASALSLDLVVDDNPENCLDIATTSEARAILVWRGTTDAVPTSARRLGVGSVSTVAECLELLDEADRAKKGGTGLKAAFRRALGLS